MPKIKNCPHCQKVLYCKTCGERFTPDLGGKTRLTTLVNEEVIRKLADEAKKEGVGINEFLKRKVCGKAAPKNSRRRAGADQPGTP